MLNTSKQEKVAKKVDIDLLKNLSEWACNGDPELGFEPIESVSATTLFNRAVDHFYDGMTYNQAKELLIRTAANLITEKTPHYDRVAARLVCHYVREQAYGSLKPPHIKEIIENNIKRGYYSRDIFDLFKYSDEEIEQLNDMIDHTRDDLLRYSGSEQMRRKYLMQNRQTKEVYESFQIPYILVSAFIFGSYPKETRMHYVKRFYELTSQHYINIPTPFMAGLRSNIKQFSSCTKIDVGDNLDSINKSASAIVNYASKKAGIGVNVGRLRASGQLIRGGDAVSTGVIPFSKYFNAALKSCAQGAVRGASATFNYQAWHLEFNDLIVLKNNKGTEDTRLRTVDYCVHLNGLLYERLANKGNITLFSPEEVKDLYDAFYSNDVKLFRELYEKYEKDDSITKKTIKAVDFFHSLITERFGTGRIFLMNVDNVHAQTSFYEPIYMTNLCTEVLSPTRPLGQDDSLIALCTLSASNWGKFKPYGMLNDEEKNKQTELLKEVCDLTVRALDSILSYQDYPEEAAKRHVEAYRSLGIGVIGFAHWLAKGNLRWGADDTDREVEEMMEKMAYFLTESSINLAKEFGSCGVRTKYHDGIFPMDNSKIKVNPKMDWDSLREKAKKYGIRNGSLIAFMPSETSSQLANETNGIEPPRNIVTNKGSKDGSFPQVVPEIDELRDNYQISWEVPVRDYLKTTAVLQAYTDQGISLNYTYDPERTPITLGTILSDIIYAYKLGHKDSYYLDIRDGTSDESVFDGDDGCESGSCKI